MNTNWSKMTTWTPSLIKTSSTDYFPRSLPPTSQPRERLSYTRYQLQLLNGIFQKLRYPNSTQKQIIAKRVGITREQVKVWFQNRRRKEVIGNQKASSEARVICIVEKETLSSVSTPAPAASVTSSPRSISTSPSTPETLLIPSIVLASIVQELLRFNDDPYRGRKIRLRRQASVPDCETVAANTRQHQSSPEVSSTDNSSDDNPTRSKTKETPSGSSSSGDSHIFSSAYDIKSPPNQITPTAAFNLREDLYRSPLHVALGGALMSSKNGKTLQQLENHFAFNTYGHSQSTDSSLTDLQSYRNFSVSDLSTSLMTGRNPFSFGFTPNYCANDVNVAIPSQFGDPLSIFPVSFAPPLSQHYRDSLVDMTQTRLSNMAQTCHVPMTSQMFVQQPIYHSVNTINSLISETSDY